ncbi:unnamed protein product [Amoebophrya sp. A120]|nr:unnamed protein product [Amoebophrya sp. A120]|eukprot:GSA120T00022367001.1
MSADPDDIQFSSSGEEERSTVGGSAAAAPLEANNATNDLEGTMDSSELHDSTVQQLNDDPDEPSNLEPDDFLFEHAQQPGDNLSANTTAQANKMRTNSTTSPSKVDPTTRFRFLKTPHQLNKLIKQTSHHVREVAHIQHVAQRHYMESTYLQAAFRPHSHIPDNVTALAAGFCQLFDSNYLTFPGRKSLQVEVERAVFKVTSKPALSTSSAAATQEQTTDGGEQTTTSTRNNSTSSSSSSRRQINYASMKPGVTFVDFVENIYNFFNNRPAVQGGPILLQTGTRESDKQRLSRSDAELLFYEILNPVTVTDTNILFWLQPENHIPLVFSSTSSGGASAGNGVEGKKSKFQIDAKDLVVQRTPAVPSPPEMKQKLQERLSFNNTTTPKLYLTRDRFRRFISTTNRNLRDACRSQLRHEYDGLEGILNLLVRKYGSLSSAWRNLFDRECKGIGINWALFRSKMAMITEKNVRFIWDFLMPDPVKVTDNRFSNQQLLTLESFDQQSFQLIEDLGRLVFKNYLTAEQCWYEYDLNEKNQIDKLQFENLCSDLGLHSDCWVELWLQLSDSFTSHSVIVKPTFCSILTNYYFKNPNSSTSNITDEEIGLHFCKWVKYCYGNPYNLWKSITGKHGKKQEFVCSSEQLQRELSLRGYENPVRVVKMLASREKAHLQFRRLSELLLKKDAKEQSEAFLPDEQQEPVEDPLLVCLNLAERPRADKNSTTPPGAGALMSGVVKNKQMLSGQEEKQKTRDAATSAGTTARPSSHTIILTGLALVEFYNSVMLICPLLNHPQDRKFLNYFDGSEKSSQLARLSQQTVRSSNFYHSSHADELQKIQNQVVFEFGRWMNDSYGRNWQDLREYFHSFFLSSNKTSAASPSDAKVGMTSSAVASASKAALHSTGDSNANKNSNKLPKHLFIRWLKLNKYSGSCELVFRFMVTSYFPAAVHGQEDSSYLDCGQKIYHPYWGLEDVLHLERFCKLKRNNNYLNSANAGMENNALTNTSHFLLEAYPGALDHEVHSFLSLLLRKYGSLGLIWRHLFRNGKTVVPRKTNGSNLLAGCDTVGFLPFSRATREFHDKINISRVYETLIFFTHTTKLDLTIDLTAASHLLQKELDCNQYGTTSAKNFYAGGDSTLEDTVTGAVPEMNNPIASIRKKLLTKNRSDWQQFSRDFINENPLTYKSWNPHGDCCLGLFTRQLWLLYGGNLEKAIHSISPSTGNVSMEQFFLLCIELFGPAIVDSVYVLEFLVNQVLSTQILSDDSPEAVVTHDTKFWEALQAKMPVSVEEGRELCEYLSYDGIYDPQAAEGGSTHGGQQQQDYTISSKKKPFDPFCVGVNKKSLELYGELLAAAEKAKAEKEAEKAKAAKQAEPILSPEEQAKRDAIRETRLQTFVAPMRAKRMAQRWRKSVVQRKKERQVEGMAGLFEESALEGSANAVAVSHDSVGGDSLSDFSNPVVMSTKTGEAIASAASSPGIVDETPSASPVDDNFLAGPRAVNASSASGLSAASPAWQNAMDGVVDELGSPAGIEEKGTIDEVEDEQDPFGAMAFYPDEGSGETEGNINPSPSDTELSPGVDDPLLGNATVGAATTNLEQTALPDELGLELDDELGLGLPEDEAGDAAGKAAAGAQLGMPDDEELTPSPGILLPEGEAPHPESVQPVSPAFTAAAGDHDNYDQETERATYTEGQGAAGTTGPHFSNLNTKKYQSLSNDFVRFLLTETSRLDKKKAIAQLSHYCNFGSPLYLKVGQQQHAIRTGKNNYTRNNSDHENDLQLGEGDSTSPEQKKLKQQLLLSQHAYNLSDKTLQNYGFKNLAVTAEKMCQSAGIIPTSTSRPSIGRLPAANTEVVHHDLFTDFSPEEKELGKKLFRKNRKENANNSSSNLSKALTHLPLAEWVKRVNSAAGGDHEQKDATAGVVTSGAAATQPLDNQNLRLNWEDLLLEVFLTLRPTLLSEKAFLQSLTVEHFQFLNNYFPTMRPDYYTNEDFLLHFARHLVFEHGVKKIFQQFDSPQNEEAEEKQEEWNTTEVLNQHATLIRLWDDLEDSVKLYESEKEQRAKRRKIMKFMEGSLGGVGKIKANNSSTFGGLAFYNEPTEDDENFMRDGVPVAAVSASLQIPKLRGGARTDASSSADNSSSAQGEAEDNTSGTQRSNTNEQSTARSSSSAASSGTSSGSSSSSAASSSASGTTSVTASNTTTSGSPTASTSKTSTNKLSNTTYDSIPTRQFKNTSKIKPEGEAGGPTTQDDSIPTRTKKVAGTSTSSFLANRAAAAVSKLNRISVDFRQFSTILKAFQLKTDFVRLFLILFHVEKFGKVPSLEDLFLEKDVNSAMLGAGTTAGGAASPTTTQSLAVDQKLLQQQAENNRNVYVRRQKRLDLEFLAKYMAYNKIKSLSELKITRFAFDFVIARYRGKDQFLIDREQFDRLKIQQYGKNAAASMKTLHKKNSAVQSHHSSFIGEPGILNYGGSSNLEHEQVEKTLGITPEQNPARKFPYTLRNSAGKGSYGGDFSASGSNKEKNENVYLYHLVNNKKHAWKKLKEMVKPTPQNSSSEGVSHKRFIQFAKICGFEIPKGLDLATAVVTLGGRGWKPFISSDDMTVVTRVLEHKKISTGLGQAKTHMFTPQSRTNFAQQAHNYGAEKEQHQNEVVESTTSRTTAAGGQQQRPPFNTSPVQNARGTFVKAKTLNEGMDQKQIRENRLNSLREIQRNLESARASSVIDEEDEVAKKLHGNAGQPFFNLNTHSQKEAGRTRFNDGYFSYYESNATFAMKRKR